MPKGAQGRGRLRRIVSRTQQVTGVAVEKLDCGHDFGKIVPGVKYKVPNLSPTSRQCPKCKPNPQTVARAKRLQRQRET